LENDLVWMTGYTAVDFRATARSNFIHETYFYPTHEKIRTRLILHQESTSFGSFFD